MADSIRELGKKERIEWIDFCRCFSMFLVIWLHFGTTPEIDGYVHLFHMPIFYYLSGYCFNESNGYKQVIQKRIRTLIVPYFGASFLVFIVTDLIHICYNSSSVVGYKDYIRHLLITCTDAVPGLGGSVQWFLPSLFFVEIIFAFLCIIKSNYSRLAVCTILALIALGLVNIIHTRCPMALDTTLAMLPFFWLGTTIKGKSTVVKEEVLILFVGIFISYLVFIFNGTVNVRLMIFGNYFFYLIGAVGGIFAMESISKLTLRFLKYFNFNYSMILFGGQNTIISLYLHRVFLTVLKECFKIGEGIYARRMMFDFALLYFVISIPLIKWMRIYILGLFGINN